MQLGRPVSAATPGLMQVERINTDWRIKAAQLLVSDFGPLPWPIVGEFGGANRHMAAFLCDLFESAREIGCWSNDSEIKTVGAANIAVRYRAEMKRGHKG